MYSWNMCGNITGIDSRPMRENTIMLNSVDLVWINVSGLNIVKNEQNEI